LGVVLSVLAVGAVGAMIPLRLLGVEYQPQEDDNTFSINMQTPPGTSLTATDLVARQMEGVLMQIPETAPPNGQLFTSISIPGGTGGGFGPRSGGRVSIDVQLQPKDQRSRSVSDII